jgi:hypothetical protein
MRRARALAVAVAAVGSGIAVMTPAPAGAVIHEIVAAYCSGGGHGTITESGELEPPGISDFNKKNFAAPVVHNGAVDLGTLTITDHRAAKFPAGTSVFDANVETTAPSHASSNCRALRP